MTNMESKAGRLVGWRNAAWVGAGLLLLLPLIAMRFTSEVNWTVSDFVIAGLLLASLVGAFEVVVRLSGSVFYRAGVCGAALGAFLMVWAQGAVGLVGSENDLFNLLFLVPLLVGACGALIVDFRADGLSRTLMAMGGLQAATIGIGFAITRDTDTFLLGFWVGLWLVCAALFRRAARG